MKYFQKFINILSTIYCLFIFSVKKNMFLSKGVRFKKIPQIIIRNRSTIKIGSNTLINSNNYGYHINMHSRCKLIADRKMAKIVIGENCRIHGTCIHAFHSIRIGDNVLIAANSHIIDANAHELSFPNVSNRINTVDIGKEIIIEDNVWIGANCFILGGVRIGEGAIISANSVVHRNVPSNAIYGGNPAVLIKQY